MPRTSYIFDDIMISVIFVLDQFTGFDFCIA